MGRSQVPQWRSRGGKVMAILALSLVLVACVVPKAAAASPRVSLASGSGTYVFADNEVIFRFDVQRRDKHHATSGFIRFDVPSVHYYSVVHVTRLDVEGHDARFCGVVTDASLAETIGWKHLVIVRDSDPSGAGDLLNPGYTGPLWAHDICNTEDGGYNWQSLTSGNIFVCTRPSDPPEGPGRTITTRPDKCKDRSPDAWPGPIGAPASTGVSSGNHRRSAQGAAF